MNMAEVGNGCSIDRGVMSNMYCGPRVRGLILQEGKSETYSEKGKLIDSTYII